MPFLLWDASALSQKYAPEPGTPTVLALFAFVPVSQMAATIMGYSETHSTLVRKRNGGVLNALAYTTATSALRLEVLLDPDFSVFDLGYDAILDGVELVNKHNVNSTDAAILMTFLRYARARTDSSCLLIVTDRRMAHAAEAEGLTTLNPEVVAPTDVPALLAAL